jgi:hypothetical protein
VEGVRQDVVLGSVHQHVDKVARDAEGHAIKEETQKTLSLAYK